jgi:hypothetical protein
MAITINNTPDVRQSFHEDLWFVVTSNNTSQPNFKYVFDVHIAGIGLVARIKSYPQPGTNKGIFNAAPIVRNYWSSYFQPSGTQSAFNYIGSGNSINYEIFYGEEYNGTLYTNLDVSDATWYQQYLGYLLTKRDKLQLQTNQTGNRLFITLQNSSLNFPIDWRLDIQRSNGNTFTSGGIKELRDICVFDVSPTGINNYLGTSFITDATDYYDISFYNYDIEDVIDNLRVYKICQPRHNHIPIHFINSLGGYDTIIFTLVNRESRNIERKSFEQAEWQYRSSDMYRWNQYNVFNGGSVQFNTQQTITYKLTSDWLNLTDYTWIRDLIASPEVYMELNSGEFIPVKISTSQWTQKKRYVDKVYNLELDIELGSKEFSQYR